MAKNIVFLGLLVWVANSMAHEVKKPELSEVETYKVEKPVKEKEGRTLAGEKKKAEWRRDAKSESDSEVRYWQYQE